MREREREREREDGGRRGLHHPAMQFQVYSRMGRRYQLTDVSQPRV